MHFLIGYYNIRVHRELDGGHFAFMDYKIEVYLAVLKWGCQSQRFVRVSSKAVTFFSIMKKPSDWSSFDCL